MNLEKIAITSEGSDKILKLLLGFFISLEKKEELLCLTLRFESDKLFQINRQKSKLSSHYFFYPQNCVRYFRFVRASACGHNVSAHENFSAHKNYDSALKS